MKLQDPDNLEKEHWRSSEHHTAGNKEEYKYPAYSHDGIWESLLYPHYSYDTPQIDNWKYPSVKGM